MLIRLVSDAFAAPIGDLTHKDPNWAHDRPSLRYRPVINFLQVKNYLAVFGTVVYFLCVAMEYLGRQRK